MENDPPPPYQAHAEDDALADPILDPAIFVLAGQSIHMETADSPAVYELSRAVATLTKSTERVAFERCDQTIGGGGGGGGPGSDSGAVPTVRLRRRHLYDLRRTAKRPRIGLSRSRALTDAPEYYVHCVSRRRALGHVGLRPFRRGGFGAGFRALPVCLSARSNQPRCDERRPALFTRRRRGPDSAEWLSSSSSPEPPGSASPEDRGGAAAVVVAVEDTAGDGEHRLIFTAAMPRREVDVLVALWCCGIWQDAAARAETLRNGQLGSSFMKKMTSGQKMYLGKDPF